MTDIRELLDRGADVRLGLPDVERARDEAAGLRRRRRALTVALAAVVLVVVGVVVSVARPEPTSMPTDTVEPRPAQAIPGPGERLLQGTGYSTASNGLPWRVTPTVSGWAVRAREDRWVSLHRGDDRVNLQIWTGVYDPEANRITAEQEQPLPADLAGWIGSHSRLQITAQRDLELAGEAWQAVDLTAARPVRMPPSECAGRPCIVLGAVGEEQVEVLASERARIYLPRSGSAGLVIVSARPASGDWTQIEALIASLTKE